MSGRLLYLRDIGVYTNSRAGNTTAARVKNRGFECTDRNSQMKGVIWLAHWQGG